MPAFSRMCSACTKTSSSCIRRCRTDFLAWALMRSSAQDAWGFDLPGFDGLKLDPKPGKGMNRDAIPNEEAEKYFFHFPDGNASIARLLVRKLIPDAIPGNSLSDVVLAKANYAKLDESGSPVRIRLNSTAVRVKHLGDAASAKEVEVSLCARRQSLYRQSEECDSGLLARGDPLHLRRSARQAETSAGVGAESSAALHECCSAQLDFVPEAGDEFRIRPRLLSHGSESGFAREHGRLRMRAQARRADRRAHDESALAIPDVPRATSTPPAAWSSTPRRSRRWSARFAISWRARWAREASIRRATSPRSPSTAGPTATPTNTTRCSIHSGSKAARLRAKWRASRIGRIAIANSDAGAYAYTDEAINQAWRAVGEITKG